MIGLDYETYCDLDLKVVGLDRYVNHTSFRVLCAAITDDRGNRLTYDFVREDTKDEKQDFFSQLKNAGEIAAQNAPFERAVTERFGYPQALVFIDTAVICRILGASSKLALAAPQLVGMQKMEEGADLIRLFSMPQKDGTIHVNNVDNWDAEMHAKFDLFLEYCGVDAGACHRIAYGYSHVLSEQEQQAEYATQRMNDIGWAVDIPLVERMQEVYQQNLEDLEYEFRLAHDPNGEINFRSPQQLAKYCKDRGVRVTSLDEQHLARYLKNAEAEQERRSQGLKPRGTTTDAQLVEVIALLRTKKELGGSSLSKLQKIRDTVGDGDRLRGQYLHAGAGQSFRTSGRGVQMQNLKRLGPEPDDVDELLDEKKRYDHLWDNARLARNLRQVFLAPSGELVVGDFSAVESRGLAYLAGEQWKLTAYRQGQDLYKVLASSMLGMSYDDVTKEGRQQGKVGELSCGYGAGPGAVTKFATKMGMEMTESEAGKIVVDWREANPKIVALWALLDGLLREVVEQGKQQSWARLTNGNLSVGIMRTSTPVSLSQLKPDACTIKLVLVQNKNQLDERLILERWFQGAHMHHGDVCYMKAGETKSGALWRDIWFKEGQIGRYKLYGGKLAGILTQSFCREIFFAVLRRVSREAERTLNIDLVGQFHDELVVEWRPSFNMSAMSLQETISWLTTVMQHLPQFPDFPLVADVKHGHRYIK